MGVDVRRAWILGGLTPDFSFDCVIKEQHAQELAITEEPLETGVVLTDHVYLRPARLAIEAAVSDVAFHPGEQDPTNPQPNDDPFASETSRSIKAYDLLLKLQASGEPFAVQTGLKLYPNMQIASLSGDQEAATASGLLFRAELQQITIASTRTVTFPPRKPGKPARQAAKKVDGGQKDAPKVTEETKAKSVLLSLGQSSDVAGKLAQSLLGLNLGGGATP